MPHQHLHLVVNAVVEAEPDIPACEAWLDALPALIGMTTLAPAKCVECRDEGNEGITGTLLISTSHVAFHWWSAGSDEPGRFSFCLYSCAGFRPLAVLGHIDSFWAIRDSRAKLLDRGWEIGVKWESGTSSTATSGTSTPQL